LACGTQEHFVLQPTPTAFSSVSMTGDKFVFRQENLLLCLGFSILLEAAYVKANGLFGALGRTPARGGESNWEVATAVDPNKNVAEPFQRLVESNPHLGREEALPLLTGESRTLPPSALQAPEHSLALPGTSDVIRRFNRDTARLTTLVVGVVVLTAVALAVLVQDRHPKATDFTDEARQVGGDLLLDANRLGTPFEVVGLNGKRFTGETPARPEQLNPGSYTVYLRPGASPEYEQTVQISCGQADSVRQVLNEAPQEIPSPTMKDAASTLIPVVASDPEINPTRTQANASFWSPAHRQYSMRVIRPRTFDARHRSELRLRAADIKLRLIALWHRSLLRSNRSRTSKMF
jgi:hypothetical protein